MRLDDLGEGGEAGAVAVGQATPLTPGDDVRALVEDAGELEDEAALADAGLADEEAKLRPAGGGGRLEGRLERHGARRSLPRKGVSALLVVRRPVRLRLSAAVFASQARTGSFLPFDLEGLERGEGDRLLGELVRELADDDAVRRGSVSRRAAVLTASPVRKVSPEAGSTEVCR